MAINECPDAVLRADALTPRWRWPRSFARRTAEITLTPIDTAPFDRTTGPALSEEMAF